MAGGSLRTMIRVARRKSSCMPYKDLEKRRANRKEYFRKWVKSLSPERKKAIRERISELRRQKKLTWTEEQWEQERAKGRA
jgi:hypothetical protein